MYRGFSKSELSQQYSPSSCVDDIATFINAYVQQSKVAKNKALNNKLVLTDLNYHSHKDTLLDLYLPEHQQQNLQNKPKLQVYIHGGYWQELSKEESCFAASNFQAHNCYFAVINYSLAPNASLSEIVEQNRQALAWLYQNADYYGYDQNEIYLSGSSAGAHLAIMMLQTDWTNYIDNQYLSADGQFSFIKGICAVSGIYDLTPIAQTYINEPLQLSPLEITKNSPLLGKMTTAEINPCKVIVSYGNNETAEFKRQSQALLKKLTLLGYPVRFQEISDRNHFDVILDLANPDSWLFNEILNQMSLPLAKS